MAGQINVATSHMLNYSLFQIFRCLLTKGASQNVLLILKLVFVCLPKSCPLYYLHCNKLLQEQPNQSKQKKRMRKSEIFRFFENIQGQKSREKCT